MKAILHHTVPPTPFPNVTAWPADHASTKKVGSDAKEQGPVGVAAAGAATRTAPLGFSSASLWLCISA